MTSSSWVKRSTPGAVGLGDDADRAAAVDDDDRAVRPLVQQRQRLADGVGRAPA